MPKHTDMPVVSAMVCVRIRATLEWYVPADVFRTRWNVYGVSRERPESFEDVLVIGLGIAANR